MQWGVVIGASLLAALCDLKSRRIPNGVTCPLALAGLVYAFASGGLRDGANSFLGLGIVALPYVLLFLFAGGGAGDAKMMGAIGAWLGVSAGVLALAAVTVTGAFMGLLNLACRRQLGAGLRRIGAAFYVILIALCSGRKGWALVRPDADEPVQAVDQRPAMPYGPAIFVGVCIAAYLVHSWNG